MSKFNFLLKKLSQNRGQGLTEYAIILSVVAVASIVAVSYFGTSIKARLSYLVAAVSGNQKGLEKSKESMTDSSTRAQETANKNDGMNGNTNSDVIGEIK